MVLTEAVSGVLSKSDKLQLASCGSPGTIVQSSVNINFRDNRTVTAGGEHASGATTVGENSK